ncbi:MAG: transketolase [Clostridia bacterium]|nr:transketolase [Clostridia bacterium]
MTTKELKLVAAKARKLCVEAVYTAASGHPGGSLSATDIMTALYFSKMRIDPANPKWEDRDRFVLSKGHCAPALYGVLALRGFFPIEDVKTFRSIDGHMSGHAEMRKINGIDMSTGSLGQGISAAVGMAMAGKLDKKDYRVYAVMGDGEIEEGQVWEAMMAANKYKLDNLCAFVDVNGLQIDGPTSVVMPTEPLDEKFASFGWNVIKIDGHNYDEILAALDAAEACKGKPTMILAKTTKGKGVSFMENSVSWHGKAPNADEYEIAVKDLDKIISELEEN